MRGSAGETAGWLKGERDEGRGGGKRRDRGGRAIKHQQIEILIKASQVFTVSCHACIVLTSTCTYTPYVGLFSGQKSES